MNLITPEIVRFAQLQAESHRQVNCLCELQIQAQEPEIIGRLSWIIPRSKARRARRMHSFILATRIPQ